MFAEYSVLTSREGEAERCHDGCWRSVGERSEGSAMRMDVASEESRSGAPAGGEGARNGERGISFGSKGAVAGIVRRGKAHSRR